MGMKLPPATAKAVLAAAGLTPAKRKRPAADVRTIGGYGLRLELALPVRVVSEANRREHWAVTKRRRDAQDDAVGVAMLMFGFLLAAPQFVPGVVTLTHVGPRMDGDNLQRAFKAVRDSVAKWMQVDDGDSRVKWEYRQETGTPGVRIRLEATR